MKKLSQSQLERLRPAVRARVAELVQKARSTDGRSDARAAEGKILWRAVGNRWGGIVRGDSSLTFSVNNPASITPYNAGKFPLHVYKGDKAANLGNFDSPEKAKAHAEKWLKGDRFEIQHFEAVTTGSMSSVTKDTHNLILASDEEERQPGPAQS